jgi:hypothetical protein
MTIMVLPSYRWAVAKKLTNGDVFFYHCRFVQNRPTQAYQTFLRAALNPIGHTACCMSYRVDTQLCLWHTWRSKKQLLILRSCSDGSERDIEKKAKGPKVCKDYDSGKAPTIYTEKTSRHMGSDKVIHQHFQSNLHDNGYSKTGDGVLMDAVREAALDSLGQTFSLLNS